MAELRSSATTEIDDPLTGETDRTFNLPASIEEGDLLLLFTRSSRLRGFLTPADWTLLDEQAGASPTRNQIFGRVATGAEGATTVLSFSTGTASRVAGIALAIQDWEGTLESGVDIAGAAGFDPPELATGWPGSDFFWITAAGTAGADSDFTVPAGYSGLIQAKSGTGGGTTYSSVAFAFGTSSSSTEDPAAWVWDGEVLEFQNEAAFTIGVLPLSTGLAFTTPPTVTSRTTNSYTLTGTLSANGQVFAVAVPHEAAAPSVAQIVAGQHAGGGSAAGSGSANTTASAPHNFSLVVSGSNIANNPSHDIHFVGRAPE